MSHSPSRHLSFFLLFVSLAINGAGCAEPDPGTGASEVGTLTLHLRSDLNGTAYELRNATFEITGESSLSLQTDDVPGASRIEHELAPGDYTVELSSGWRLFELGSAEDVEVPAKLLSDNPTPFTVTPAGVTPVSYRFEVSRAALSQEPGTLELEIAVQHALQRAVVFNEIMSNPAELPDTQGEWIELLNVGSDPVELNGCSLQRDATQISLAASLVVEPGGFVTLSNGASPGFTPDYVYTKLTLPNSAVFVLSLSCDGELLDSVTIDPKTFPGGNGVAASLAPSRATPQDNDRAESWCNATTSYTSDKGTPGAPNPSCP